MIGDVEHAQWGERAAASADDTHRGAPADAVAHPAPDEIEDDVGCEHDREDAQPLLQREADRVDVEDGQKQQKAELRGRGDHSDQSTETDPGLCPDDGYAGEQHGKRMAGAVDLQALKPALLLNAKQCDQSADDYKNRGNPQRSIAAIARYAEAGQQRAERREAAGTRDPAPADRGSPPARRRAR